jgi:hypothetical protein
MNVQMVVERDITRPATTPIPSSLLDHVEAAGNLVQVDHFGLRNEQGMWPSYNCLDTLVPVQLCAEVVTPKTFGFSEWIPGFSFGLQGGAQCLAVGLDEADQNSEVERVFAVNEGRGVEEAMLLNRFFATTSDDPVQWDAPIDLTPSPAPTGGISLSTALALLEGYAASVYAGVPTIHMPRAAALKLFGIGVLKEVDGLYFTKTGSKVAAGGGYDDPDMLATGEWTMYATGEVYVERSERLKFQSRVIPGDGNGTGSDETGIPENSVLTLAERLFRVAVDCFVAKATGTVWTA